MFSTTFKMNTHVLDRVFRFVGGAVLVYATLPGSGVFDDQFFSYPALAFGLVNIVVAVVGWCPVYNLLKISSRKVPSE